VYLWETGPDGRTGGGYSASSPRVQSSKAASRWVKSRGRSAVRLGAFLPASLHSTLRLRKIFKAMHHSILCENLIAFRTGGGGQRSPKGERSFMAKSRLNARGPIGTFLDKEPPLTKPIYIGMNRGSKLGGSRSAKKQSASS